MRKKRISDRTKPVTYELINPDGEAGKHLYPLMAELIEKHHEELTPARIALAWNLSWKPDVDGRVTLGKCKKATDLDRELAAFDFVIVLRKEFFEDAAVKDEQRRALIDHELCHAAPKLDPDTGEQIEDSKGRKVWRTRKHDIEEFSDIVARHGLYKRDLEQFAAALRMSKQGRLSMEDVAGALARDPKVRRMAQKIGGHVTISAPGGPTHVIADDTAAQFVASLGERNGMDDREIKRRLWEWCADKGIRGTAPREALWLGVKELVATKPAELAPESGLFGDA